MNTKIPLLPPPLPHQGFFFIHSNPPYTVANANQKYYIQGCEKLLFISHTTSDDIFCAVARSIGQLFISYQPPSPPKVFFFIVICTTNTMLFVRNCCSLVTTSHNISMPLLRLLHYTVSFCFFNPPHTETQASV